MSFRCLHLPSRLVTLKTFHLADRLVCQWLLALGCGVELVLGSSRLTVTPKARNTPHTTAVPRESKSEEAVTECEGRICVRGLCGPRSAG